MKRILKNPFLTNKTNDFSSITTTSATNRNSSNIKSKLTFLSQFAPLFPVVIGGDRRTTNSLPSLSTSATTPSSQTTPIINSRTLNFNYAIDDADICRAVKMGDQEFFILSRTQVKTIRAFRYARGTCFHLAVKCLQPSICKVLVILFGFGKLIKQRLYVEPAFNLHEV